MQDKNRLVDANSSMKVVGGVVTKLKWLLAAAGFFTLLLGALAGWWGKQHADLFSKFSEPALPGWQIIGVLVVLVLGLLFILMAGFVGIFAVLNCCGGCGCKDSGADKIPLPTVKGINLPPAPMPLLTMAAQLTDLKTKIQDFDTKLQTIATVLDDLSVALKTAGDDMKTFGDKVKSMEIPVPNQHLGHSLDVRNVIACLNNLKTNKPFDESGMGDNISDAGVKLQAVADGVKQLKTEVVDPLVQSVNTFVNELP
jgi:hypothetical protein